MKQLYALCILPYSHDIMVLVYSIWFHKRAIQTIIEIRKYQNVFLRIVVADDEEYFY